MVTFKEDLPIIKHLPVKIQKIKYNFKYLIEKKEFYIQFLGLIHFILKNSENNLKFDLGSIIVSINTFHLNMYRLTRDNLKLTIKNK